MWVEGGGLRSGGGGEGGRGRWLNFTIMDLNLKMSP